MSMGDSLDNILKSLWSASQNTTKSGAGISQIQDFRFIFGVPWALAMFGYREEKEILNNFYFN